MEGILFSIFILALGLVLILIQRRRSLQDRDQMAPDEDEYADDEVIFVEYKGFYLSMTQLERIEFWDRMSAREKKDHLISVRRSIKKGIHCYCRIPWYSNPVIVTKGYAKAHGFKIEKGISSSDRIKQTLKK